MTEALAHAAGLGLSPRTLIDVGVADGTPELYAAFPDAHLVLIEPLKEHEVALQGICRAYDAEYLLAAANSVAGSTRMHVHRDLTGSSLLREIEGSHVDGLAREVPTVRIDDVCVERHLKAPFLIKIDVQGAELMVLEGTRNALAQTDCVVLEVSLFGTLVGGPQLHEVVSYMKGRGFVVYDLFGGLHRPLDGALAQLDMMFVRENGPLRSSHAYATREQRMMLIEKARSRLPPERKDDRP
ncbi:MAG TPA: FkbM family methyltransferase [Thermoplasmata archaeon]|nr:FkbM family methyltransferase [Thermoplasmata archaeon]